MIQMLLSQALMNMVTDRPVIELSDGKEISGAALICRLGQDAVSIANLNTSLLTIGSDATFENLYCCLLGIITGTNIKFVQKDDFLGASRNLGVTKVVLNTFDYFNSSAEYDISKVSVICKNLENTLTNESRSFDVELSTSGSSGLPKIIILSEADLIYQASEVSNLLGLNRKSKQLFYMPINYIYGLSIITTWLVSCSRIIIPRSSLETPTTFFEELILRRITVFSGVPYTYNMMARWGPDKFEGSSLTALTQAGGRLRLGVKEKIVSTLKGVDFWIMYGQTEFGGRISQYKLGSNHIEETCVGRLLPGIQIHIDLDEAYSQFGEIFLASPSICKNIEDIAEPKMIGGCNFYPTGDIGKFENGLLYITDRNKNFIKIGGARISSAKLERYFNNLGGIQDCFLCLSNARSEKILIGLHTDEFQSANTQWELSKKIDEVLGEKSLAAVLDNKPHEVFLLHGGLPLLPNGKPWIWKIHEIIKEASSGKNSLHIWL